eukprot:3268595-Rhodomonas_salina.1
MEMGADGLPILPAANFSRFQYAGATAAQRALWDKAFLWLGSDRFQPHRVLASREPAAFGIPQKCA